MESLGQGALAVKAALFLIVVASLSAPTPLPAQALAAVRPANDSVSIRMVDTDLRAAIQALSRYLPRPVLTGTIPAVRVSVETPAPVSHAGAAALLKGLVEAHNLEFLEDSAFIRIGPKPIAPPTPPPVVQAAGIAGAAGQIRMFVIRLKHARAADVAATVNLLFGASGGFSGTQGLSNGTLSDELRRSNLPAQTPAVPADSASRPATLGGAVTMVPDQLTNSLLVRARPEDFDILREAVDQLDIRPFQVLIEVLIVEARHDRNFSLGTDLFMPPTSLGGDQTIDGQLLGGGLGDLVLRLMNLGKANIDAVLRTAQSKGDVEIISRPVLLASNNTEARFLVGSQRPFVSVSRSLPTDSPSRDQVVQYRDVGTKLVVRPTINQDGYVSLVIQQEISAATNETQFDAPVISTREVSTQVLVRDGQTIVLGGLRDKQRDRTRSGVPVLSGLPIIGGLFGTTTRRSSATELYLFLTPRIIRSDADADSLTAPRLEEMGQ
jgi:general secretion pathway protein D